MRIVDRCIRNFLAFVISLYQKYVSPSKGFRCAHHALHSGETCSQYVKRSLLEQDLMTAIKLSQQRFNQCGEAAFKLSQRRERQQQLASNTTVQLNLPKLQGRRYFLLVAVPAFLVAMASPAWARSSRGVASCAGRSAQAGYREDSRDGECGDPNIWYGICCGLSIMGAAAESNK
jgi:putative component of membrane protein insertase Oxa1/YidC/SpoIIIJ protein YidD